MMDFRPLQARLGLAADGIAGPATYTALFSHFGAKPDRARELAGTAVVYFAQYGLVDSKLRLAHFMAQLVHESGGFRYMEEIASGAAYEGRRDLGNTQVGDGRRYKGRGPIQITGRANYKKYGEALGLDLIGNPTIAAQPAIGLRLALEYWKTHRLNELADKDDIRTITRRINGGHNGLPDRIAQLSAVKALLS